MSCRSRVARPRLTQCAAAPPSSSVSQPLRRLLSPGESSPHRRSSSPELVAMPHFAFAHRKSPELRAIASLPPLEAVRRRAPGCQAQSWSAIEASSCAEPSRSTAGPVVKAVRAAVLVRSPPSRRWSKPPPSPSLGHQSRMLLLSTPRAAFRLPPSSLRR
jgi:hypothetical protein